jgi:hypothetical protein
MDDVVNRFAKELADAIAAAVAENPQVEACRAKAREAGFDMKVTLEAVVGFVNRNNGAAVTKITTPARLLPARRAFELTANDKRSSVRCASAPTKQRNRRSKVRTRQVQIPNPSFQIQRWVWIWVLGFGIFYVRTFPWFATAVIFACTAC